MSFALLLHGYNCHGFFRELVQRGYPGIVQQGQIFFRPPALLTLLPPCLPSLSQKLEESRAPFLLGLLLCLQLPGICVLWSLLAGWALALSSLPRAPPIHLHFSFACSPAFTPTEEHPPWPASPVSSENGAKETAPSPLRPCSYCVRSGSCIHLSAKEMHRTCHCFSQR